MTDDKRAIGRRDIIRVTNWGIAGNILLSIIKMLAGWFTGSMALIADGVHSLSDLISDAAVYLGAYFGSKEPDTLHPYGHGRFESLAALAVSLILIAAGGVLIYRASGEIARLHNNLIEPRAVSSLVLAVAVLSIIVKECMYRITRRVALRSHSSMVYANAWHHRSDAISSVAVVVGFFAQKAGYRYGDQLAAVAVGMMIILVGVRILGGCIREFSEGRADEQTIELIKEIINAESRIKGWHRLRTRIAGREVFMDIHILVNPTLTITDAHKISETLENTLHEKISRPMNITVHIEPDIPELRKDV